MYYAGLSHLGTVSNGKDGVKNVDIGNNLVISVVVAMFILPLVDQAGRAAGGSGAAPLAIRRRRRLVRHFRFRVAFHGARHLSAELRRYQGAGVGAGGVRPDPRIHLDRESALPGGDRRFPRGGRTECSRRLSGDGYGLPPGPPPLPPPGLAVGAVGEADVVVAAGVVGLAGAVGAVSLSELTSVLTSPVPRLAGTDT